MRILFVEFAKDIVQTYPFEKEGTYNFCHMKCVRYEIFLTARQNSNYC